MKIFNWLKRKKPLPVSEPPMEIASPANEKNLSICPDHTASICHLLLHVHPEVAGVRRKGLIDGTLTDKEYFKVNERFKHLTLALWAKESTVDDIKYAFSKLAYTSEVR